MKTCLGLAALLLLSAFDACAGFSVPITVGYSPHPSPVPFLSPQALIALLVLTSVILHRAMRDRGCGKFFSAFFITGALTVGTASMKQFGFIRSADAVDQLCPVNLTQASGGTGTGTIHAYPSTCTVTNSSGVSQDVNSITPPTGTFEIAPTLSPRCVSGSTTLNAGGVCYIRINTG